MTTANGKQTCSIEVTVFKMLELESPKRITTEAIIVPPRSQVNLKANLPDVTFIFVNETVGGLRVSADGVLKTGEDLGRDIVIVRIIFNSVNSFPFLTFNDFRLNRTIKHYRYRSKSKTFIMCWPHCTLQPLS